MEIISEEDRTGDGFEMILAFWVMMFVW